MNCNLTNVCGRVFHLIWGKVEVTFTAKCEVPLVCSYNQSQRCWNSQAYLSVIFLLLIFNVDPHRTGMDSIMKRNIETGVARRIPFCNKGLR